MKLENLSLEDLVSFFLSLSQERRYFTLSLREILNSDFVIGCWCNENLAGIGGILKTYNLIPTLFVVVESQFQGRGLGNELVQSIIRLAKESYDFLCLTVMKENHRALSLFRKNGFEICYNGGKEYWMGLRFNRRGEFLRRLLSLFLRVRYSPLAPLLRRVYYLQRHW